MKRVTPTPFPYPGVVVLVLPLLSDDGEIALGLEVATLARRHDGGDRLRGLADRLPRRSGEGERLLLLGLASAFRGRPSRSTSFTGDLRPDFHGQHQAHLMDET